MRDFPKMVYRAVGAKVENRIVTNAEALAAAEQEGWGELVAAKEAAAKAPLSAAPASQSAVEAGRRLVAAESENARLKDTLALHADFLARVRDDENCPDGLKAAIDEMMGAPEAKPKRKRGSA